MREFLTYATAVILAGGILTCWVTDFWALAAYDASIFVLGIVWMVSAWRQGRAEWDWLILGIASIPTIGVLQLISGVTVNRWETLRELLGWLASAVMMLLILQFAGSRRLREQWLTILVIFAAIIAVFGVIQNFTSPGKVFGIFDSGYPDLVIGPFVYRNKFAQFVELFLTVALFRAVTERGRTTLWLAVAAAMIGGTVASGSRSGFGLGVVEIVAFLAIVSRSRWMAQYRNVLSLAAQTALLVLIASGVVGWELLATRFQLDPLSDARIPIMRSSADMVKARPLTGFGLGAWDKAYPEFARFDNGLYVNQAHCDWLQWPGEGGLLMLGVMLWVGWTSISLAIRHPWALGVAIVFLHGVVDYPMHQVQQFATMVFAIIAAGLAERRAGFRDIRVS